jgi:diphthamide biosynthesis protein 3
MDGVVHDEVEIEDFEYDPNNETFTYPCPCGDEFTVTREELVNGENFAKCPSCSLMVQVIFDVKDLESIVANKSAYKQSQINRLLSKNALPLS